MASTRDDDDDDDDDDADVNGRDVGDFCLRRGTWTEKRSDRTRAWSKRFARWSEDGTEIEFRVDANDAAPSSKVPLSRVRGCVASSLNIGKQCPAGCGIYIDVEGSKEGVFLRCESASRASAFVEAVREARMRGKGRRRDETPRTPERASEATAASRASTNGESRARETPRTRDLVKEFGNRAMHVGEEASDSPAGSMDTRGRVLDTFGAMEIALQAKDELLAAEAMGRSSLEAALRSEKKFSAELQKKVTSMRERMESREKELKLVRENLEMEKAYASELKDQLEEALIRSTEMEDTAAAATMEIDRLDRELADARATRERMEEALLNEAEYVRQREVEQFQRQRHLETQLNEARQSLDELEIKHQDELAEVRRRSSHAVAVANTTEQELLLSRDRLLSELARMRREGYETVLLSGGKDSARMGTTSTSTTPSRARTVPMPTTPSRLGQISPSPQRARMRETQVHRTRDSPRTPRSHALHPEPEETPNRTRRALFNRGAQRSPSKRVDASRVIDRLDSPGTHGCRVQ
ncbi:unnamed product [Ostreococcus tauri]|uniref:Unnamed product n=1 Tax=Ostreococcus tauri TaxID=70448 RepID=Q018C1_OSTTA|nr:unnamed product [Ostreococcus tauri]OUS47733.1 hypothetical protein BE221DRAFT_69640 [Ostreococcus tauri]CAL54254.1 unnamed product [Ostreococcus tauri]|eukprot:XP_003079596.1 unnamed product [Ostreococcus tauri]